MRVRDMHLYWCELCWGCVMFFGAMWVLFPLATVYLLFVGAWTASAWAGGATLVSGGMLFLVAYLEARDHWKGK